MKLQGLHTEGELSLREIQLASLEVLKKIDTVCQKEGIRYWLMYGSLIGAVRHHGFIPWDDDIDIAMPRPDYEKFLDYCQTHANELTPLVVLHSTPMRRVPFLITRVSDTTYRMVGEYAYDVPELGVFVDVYPIDGCGDIEADATAHKEACLALSKQYGRAENYAPTALRCGLKWHLKCLRAKALGDSSKYANRLEEMVKKFGFEQSAFVSCSLWQESSAVWRRELCEQVIPMQFEDMQASVPVGYDEILRRIFGDYMSFPPKEDQAPHHLYSIVKRA